MSRRTYGTNAFRAATTGLVTTGTDVVPLDTVLDLAVPGYITLSPFDATIREVIKFTTINGNNLEGLTRGLPGSTGGVSHEHPAGAVVISAPTEQVVDDIFSDIEDLETADTDHVGGADPHPLYQTEAESDARYVEVAGDNMTGLLYLLNDPTGNLGAATKQYVDTAESGAVATAGAYSDGLDHHAKYTDADAEAAIATVDLYVKISGDSMDGELEMNQNIVWDLPAPGNPNDAARKAYVDAPAVPVTDQPGGIVQAAPASGVIQRWNGDGDTSAHRHFEWRRGSAFGTLELYAIQSNGDTTLAIQIDSDGVVTIPNLAP